MYNYYVHKLITSNIYKLHIYTLYPLITSYIINCLIFEMGDFDGIVRSSAQSLDGIEITNPWVIFNKKHQLLKFNLRVWNSSTRD